MRSLVSVPGAMAKSGAISSGSPREAPASMMSTMKRTKPSMVRVADSRLSAVTVKNASRSQEKR